MTFDLNIHRNILLTSTLVLILNFGGLAQSSNKEVNKKQGTNYAHVPNTIIRADGDSLAVHIKGDGEIPIVMIPGHMQYSSLYDNFIERNGKHANFHVVIPPGMGGTAAYPWPEDADEFASRPWSTQFENELTSYIDNNIPGKPYMIVNWYSGLGMALNMAEKRPDLFSGIIFTGPAGRSPYYRWYRPDSTNADRLFDTEAQNQSIGRFIDFWRTVDEHTWHSNMFPASFYSIDKAKGFEVVYNESKHPMPISLRYFVEYVMDDLTQEVRNLSVPVVAISLMPSKKTLKSRLRGNQDVDRSHQRLKDAVLRDWQTDKNANIRVEFIEDSGLLVWDDKPKQFDRIFLEFISKD